MTTISVGQQLSCRVLGPLEVAVDGVPVVLSGVLVRRLLAALVLAEGHAVPDDELLDLLWPGQQQVKALRVVVWRLRSALGTAADRLERTSTGYQFLLPEQTDQHRFTDLVAAGLRQQSTSEPAAAIATLSAALDLWRGDPWQDLAPATGASGLVRRRAGERARLVELRELAVEEREAARFAVGSPWPVVRTLSQLVADSPYRERRWELLALALQAAGRPDRAAAELRRYRLMLVDDLGLDPSPTLTALEHRLTPRRPGWRWR
ncbi:AfsR/SARP family transcriptional regulator [Kribbella sindirgiensis]|uniref:SARP family transcriptional regulator n=1 Tax=Kribbella sindirgiensis TaxID=1124744 RepID=A0A4R0I885_9ACTN|nr:BTAD domain-containing putative transcriptional regulator [Kribbella sindirgiensis]TCC28427.1 SARP family transcriptional regulator [Kribbella sindirgiensis]